MRKSHKGHKNHHKGGGFTLIEILIVVTILSLLAVLGLPSLLETLDRGRHAATLADLKEIGAALERYAVDHQHYPLAEDILALRPVLEPKYIKRLPLKDGWDSSLSYEIGEEGSTYRLRSPGKDGEWQEFEEGEKVQDFTADIVYIDGAFIDPFEDAPEAGS